MNWLQTFWAACGFVVIYGALMCIRDAVDRLTNEIKRVREEMNRNI